MGLTATEPKEVGPGKWRFRVNLPPEADGSYPTTQRTFTFTDKDGKPVGKREGKRLAADKVAEVLRDLEQHDCVDPARLTFGEMCRRWMEWEGLLVGTEEGIQPVTLDFYQGYLDRDLLPAFENRIAAEIRPADVIALKGEKGKTHSRSTVSHVVATARAAYSWAIEEGQLLDASNGNPAMLPRRRQRRGGQAKQRAKREYTTWTQDEIARAVVLAEGQLVLVPLMLAGWHGLRRGEVCGLWWEDFDTDTGKLHVQRSLEQVGSELHVSPPKSAAGNRWTEPVPPALAEALAELLKVDEGHRRRDPKWNPEGYVLTTGRGTPIKPRNLSSAWSDFCRRRKLEHLRFHDLRHSFATDLIFRQGVDIITVSKMLGHADPAITASLYAHPDEEVRRDAGMSQNRRIAAALAKASADSGLVQDDAPRLRVVGE